jgi:hypothetical protein
MKPMRHQRRIKIEVTPKEGQEKHRKTDQKIPFQDRKTLKKEKTGRETFQKHHNTQSTIISKHPSAIDGYYQRFC